MQWSKWETWTRILAVEAMKSVCVITTRIFYLKRKSLTKLQWPGLCLYVCVYVRVCVLTLYREKNGRSIKIITNFYEYLISVKHSPLCLRCIYSILIIITVSTIYIGYYIENKLSGYCTVQSPEVNECQNRE